MAEETIVAVYDTVAHADAAVRDLEAANVPSGAITRHSADSAGAGVSTDTSQAAPRPSGFWSGQFGGEPDHDTAVYDRSLQAGSTVVMVKAPEQYIDSVSVILERHSPIDMDERAAGYGLGTSSVTTATSTTAAPLASTATSTSTTASALTGGTATAATGAATGEEVIGLSEEQIAIGKRMVNRGTTRVRRFVVETPVEENVTLRSEQVSIQRRPVAAGTTVPESSFTDKVVEFKETDEEAVVGKTAHVKEEVVVRKDVADRVETIHDTVRREEVEIEKIPGTTTERTTSTIADPARKL